VTYVPANLVIRPALAAELMMPNAVAVDRFGNLYITEPI
jgi:hypothetical protein